MPQQGEIWEAPFPYSDKYTPKPKQGRKQLISFDGDIRPVLILSNNAINQTPEIVVCQITSKISNIAKLPQPLKQTITIIESHELKQAGLDYPSAIKPFKLFTLRVNNLLNKRGQIPQTKLQKALGSTHSLF